MLIESTYTHHANLDSLCCSCYLQQVFQLLEALYKAFDEIAKRRRVFKIETIGMSICIQEYFWVPFHLTHAVLLLFCLQAILTLL